jgi:uncharacterized integral membrane protein
MITVLEIILTISAWKRGWRWRALLPLALGCVAAFLVGAAAGANGGSVEDVLPIAVLLELAVVGSLIAMVARSPRTARLAGSSQTGILADAGPDPSAR